METRRTSTGLPEPKPQQPMKKLLLTGALLMTTGVAFALAYTYQCPRCGLVQTYGTMGIYRCPNDGAYLIPAR